MYTHESSDIFSGPSLKNMVFETHQQKKWGQFYHDDQENMQVWSLIFSLTTLFPWKNNMMSHEWHMSIIFFKEISKYEILALTAF